MSVSRAKMCRVLWRPVNNELKMTWNDGSNMQVHGRPQSVTDGLITNFKTQEFPISI